MSSQIDQFAAELTGPGSIADKEYARLLAKTSQPAGKYSLRDLYTLAGEVPRLILGRYTSVGPQQPASSAALRTKILSYSPVRYWPGDMWANGYPEPDDLGGVPVTMTSTGFVTESPNVGINIPDAEICLWITGNSLASTAPTNEPARGSMTLLGIIKPTNTTADTAVFGHETAGAEDFRWAYTPGGNVALYGAAGTPSITGLVANNTYFIAHSIQSGAGNARAFVNGQLFASGTLTGSPAGGNYNWRIGHYSGGPSFPGYVCHLAVIPTALTDLQIEELYNIAFVGI